MDWLGLGGAAAIGAFATALMTGVDALLLSRQITLLNELAARWFVFFDGLRLPHLPKVVSTVVGKYSWAFKGMSVLLLVPSVSTLLLAGVINWRYGELTFPPDIALLAFYTALAAIVIFVYYIFATLISFASDRGYLILILFIMAAVIYYTVQPPDPTRYSTEGDILAAVFMYMFVCLAIIPAAVYIAILASLFLLMASFWIFKLTVCHLLELSVERKTIFAHVGVLIGIVVAGGKLVLELSKLFAS